MLKTILVTLITLVCVSGYAKSKEVMGVIARCDCFESTIDGVKNLGKAHNVKPARTERGARNQAFVACSKQMDDASNASVDNCTYIKAIDEKVGKVIKRRIEKLTGDDESNLQNDLLSTL